MDGLCQGGSTGRLILFTDYLMVETRSRRHTACVQVGFIWCNAPDRAESHTATEPLKPEGVVPRQGVVQGTGET